MADVCAFCGGRLLGGPFLSVLSPAKRWSGVVVGGLAGLATLAALGALTWPLALAVAVGAPVGDLVESMVKVFGAAAGRAHVGVVAFVTASVPARGLRILLVGLLAGAAGAVLTRWRRFYPAVIAAFAVVFGAGLATVVHYWT